MESIFNDRKYMNCDFFTVTGWLFGLISLMVAIMQYRKKEVYRKQLKMEQRNDGNATGYQANNITVNNKK